MCYQWPLDCTPAIEGPNLACVCVPVCAHVCGAWACPYAPMPVRICMRMYTCPYVYTNTRVTRARALCVRVYTQASAGGTGEFNARANYDT